MPLRKKRKGSGDDEGVDDEEFEVDSEEESSSSDEGSVRTGQNAKPNEHS